MALAVAFGIGVAAMSHPGIASAEPTADTSPDSSEVEGAAGGGPDPKTELGVVSSGGSTPPAGAGSVDAGSGSDESSDPDQAGATTGSTETSSEPAPGVIVRSSGGALTAGEQEQTADTQQAVQDQAESPSSSVVTTPTDEQIVSAAAALPAVEPVIGTAAADADVANTLTASTSAARHATLPVVSTISEIPSPTARLSVVGVGGHGAAIWHQPVAGAVDVTTIAMQGHPQEVHVEQTAQSSVRTFAGILTAALAPFVLPLPGSPVEESTLWAVLAWARRQFDEKALDQRLNSMVPPRQTEMILADETPPGASVDRVDQVTGRVTGSVIVADLSDGERDGLTYALVKQIDRRLGVVTVNGATGRWTFAPNQVTRLAAQLDHGGGFVSFSVVASNGRTIDVRAPVSPAEAVVTDTVEGGDGLIYGLAVVGDRLCILSGADDAAGNGRVKIIDTTTKVVIASVEVGSMPFAMAANGRSLYVGNADDGTVSVIDVATSRVVDVIDVGANPFGLEATGDRLYVADHAGTMSVIDLNDNTELARIPIDGEPFGIATTADRVYVTNYAGGTLAVVDQATNSAVDAVVSSTGVDQLDVAGYPYAAAVVGGRLYVANSATNALTIVDRSVTTVVDIDPHTRAVDAIPAGAAPVEMVVRGDRLYVSNVNRGTVVVVDVATNQPVESIGVGMQPGLMTATPEGCTIYVADVLSSTVRVITSARHAANG